MKLVILGSKGQLGNKLLEVLKKYHETFAFSREDLDITDHSKIFQTIKAINPNIIINSTAFTAVDKAESDKDSALLINSLAVENLAKISKMFNIFLIHYSTDYVFDGKKNGCYLESDPTNPLNMYGLSKLQGEESITRIHDKFYIFRLTWLIGSYGNNFAKTIIQLALKNEELKIINDQFGVPTTTTLVADVTKDLIHKIKINHPWPFGIYHLTPDGSTTWYEMAKELMTIATKEHRFKFKLNKMIPISSREYKTVAARPTNSILCNQKIKKFFSFSIPIWKTSFNAIANDILVDMKNEKA